MLKSQGANVRAYHDTALQSAAHRGHADIVELLPEHSADTEADYPMGAQVLHN
ncbi:hypothetical protein M427DRAFT_58971 [Gonapodya prolifera JEL478]|uniref:Uncharacterized protein n=1 Tax=Gonapodya prolifera (strain JEL478) TaxID=1344416 RepID=A0A139A8J8_GONPJ|nr:hypothetical protein M427DRAFT_58971 [Gonapodya prolifera JEL478]|eukprot:KXS13057.1 hypothetical protein M427DRAFT_58971 [Gonapodya prolifera JEL478]